MKLIFSVILFLNALASNEVPEYAGNVIDLSTYPIASLYKGTHKRLIKNAQNAREISEITRKESGLWYLQLEFQISEETINKEDIWLKFRSNIHVANLYLNGRLFLRNGTVEYDTTSEKGGKNIVIQKVPKEYLVEGPNKIEIEFTNYKRLSNTIIRDLSLGNLEAFQHQTAIMVTAPMLFFGIFLFVLLINLVLYFSLDRKKVFLLLALLFLVNSVMMMYEVLYWNGFVPSYGVIDSYMLRSGLEHLSYCVLLTVLFYEYALPKKTVYTTIVIFLIVYLFANFTDTNISIALSLLPFGLSLIGSFKKIKGSTIITISLFILFVLNFLDDKNILEDLDFVNSNYIITSLFYKLDSIGMIIFALVMIFISAKSILSTSKSLNEATLKLERLEYQFLQKLILPHFMVNSLMSLQHLVSKEPKKASIMIDALSEEFHLLAAMSKKKFVPIAQEIEICRTHLSIMSIQQKAHYTIEVKEVNGDEMIPPTIIHTLIENGITHGYSGNQNARFVLSKKETANSIIYRLFNDSYVKRMYPATTLGTGLKYVQARLEECYSGKWNLHSNRVENGWESVIEIIKNS